MTRHDTPDSTHATGPSAPAPVLVGYDESQASRAALHWAAREAVETGLPLRVLVIWSAPVEGGWGAALGRSGQQWGEDVRQRVLGSTRSLILDRVPVSVEDREGDPADELLSAAREASVLVLGSRGHLGGLGALLGSVSRECVNHSVVPVVVLGPDADPAPDQRVVVASRDGYAEGPAVAWAVERAAGRHHELLLLDRWRARSMGPELTLDDAREAARLAAEQRHSDALDELRRELKGAARVTGHLVEGRGVDVEYAATSAGDLLVVDRSDSEHRPSFRYERCPVVVVPDDLPSGGARAGATASH